MAIQDKWAWCNKCQALCFAGGASMGKCPAGGSHNHSGSGNYALVDTDPTVPGQDNWRWCKKCQALSFAGSASPGGCPGGGVHDHAGSGNYNLLQKGSGAAGQQNWKWCKKCQVLAFAGAGAAGVCAGGGTHDYSGSGNYVMAQVPDCSALKQQVTSLQNQIKNLQNSPGYTQGPDDAHPGKPDPEMLKEVKALETELGPKSKAYKACENGKLVLLASLRALPGPRHFGPTPFYLMGHNTNTISEVKTALNQGANSVEVDVTAYSNNANKLCIDHAGVTGDAPGSPSAPAFEDFLHGLRAVADARPELAMVMFDLKPPATRPDFGPVLINAIRNILTKNSNLPVILSVADVTTSHPDRLDGTTVFDQIHAGRGEREGYMIDCDNNTDGVVSFFKGLGVANFGYGNGISFGLSDEGAMVYRTPIEKACWLRATTGKPDFVDAWTVNSVDNLKLYMRIGVDGVISDANGIERALELLQQSEFSHLYRMARRTDNPMVFDNFAYGLKVKTTDTGSAGTDSKITFTVTGQNGSSSTTVDTNYNARMEQGQTNFVVIHSPDLGPLKSVTVKSDQAKPGSGWHLASIQVQSHRFGVNKTATFGLMITSTDAVTRNLV